MGNESAAEKTESATPRRREKEREHGNISQSRDFSSALVVTCSVALLAAMGPLMTEKIANLLRYTFTNLNPKDICQGGNIMGVLMPYIHSCASIVVPFSCAMALAALIIVRRTVGGVFAIDKIKFDFQNIAPSRIWSNTKKMFNPFEPRVMVEFVKSIIKLTVVGACGFATANSRKDELFAILGADPATSLKVICSILTK